jgi:hypothetical protein
MVTRMLRSADGLVSPAVAEAIQALPLAPEDAGAMQVARNLAQAIDDAIPEERVDVLARLAPKLLDALESLGATPRARAAIKKGAGGERKSGALSTLRAARPA